MVESLPFQYRRNGITRESGDEPEESTDHAADGAAGRRARWSACRCWTPCGRRRRTAATARRPTTGRRSGWPACSGPTAATHTPGPPKGRGRDFELSPILKPLARHKNEVLVLTHLSNRGTFTGDGHYVKDAAWLTGTTIRRTTGSDLDAGGVSIDQLAARRIGVLTPIPSLELGVEPVTTGVDTNVGYTRLYGSHISWSSPTTPVAREINPRLAFDRLFRSGAGKRSRRRRRPEHPRPRAPTTRVPCAIGSAATTAASSTSTSTRSAPSRSGSPSRPATAAPGIVDDAQARGTSSTSAAGWTLYKHDPGRFRERSMNHTEHVRLMLDILLLALQTDSTRIATFMFGNSVSNKNFSFLEGVKGGHHQFSHHENDPEKLEQYQRITTWHIEQCAYLLDRMKQIREGEGTLLDHSMVLFGSALRDGNGHDPHDLPTVLAGRAGGTLAPGRHLIYGKDTPLCNLYVSMLDRIGRAGPAVRRQHRPARGARQPRVPGDCDGLIAVRTGPSRRIR